jgi:hypothetical protein
MILFLQLLLIHQKHLFQLHLHHHRHHLKKVKEENMYKVYHFLLDFLVKDLLAEYFLMLQLFHYFQLHPLILQLFDLVYMNLLLHLLHL